MDKKLALLVLREAEEGEYISEIPEEDEELIQKAIEVVAEADKAVEQGWGANNETIIAIRGLVEASTFPRRSSGGYSEQDHRDVPEEPSEVFQKLPLPGEPTISVSMPEDISSLLDDDLRRYSSIFNHYFGRARWLLADETIKLAYATHIRDEAYRVAFSKADGAMHIREAEAKGDKEYSEWDEKVLEHQNNVTKLRALTDIYEANIERLSREATIRQNEWDRGK